MCMYVCPRRQRGGSDLADLGLVESCHCGHSWNRAGVFNELFPFILINSTHEISLSYSLSLSFFFVCVFFLSGEFEYKPILIIDCVYNDYLICL